MSENSEMTTTHSGAPVVLFPDEDEKSSPTASNTFCTPRTTSVLSLHIFARQIQDSVTTNARIVRDGIPYGSELKDDPTPKDPNGKHGLLFACY